MHGLKVDGRPAVPPACKRVPLHLRQRDAGCLPVQRREHPGSAPWRDSRSSRRRTRCSVSTRSPACDSGCSLWLKPLIRRASTGRKPLSFWSSCSSLAQPRDVVWLPAQAHSEALRSSRMAGRPADPRWAHLWWATQTGRRLSPVAGRHACSTALRLGEASVRGHAGFLPALQAVGGLPVGGRAGALRNVQRGQHLLEQRQARMLRPGPA